MNVYIKIILACFISNYFAAQTVISTCSLNDTIAPLYKDDADRLAVRRVFHINSTWKDSVFVNQQISDRYLQAFIAVHNATNIPARDTVVEWLKIHTNPNPQLRDFQITADSNLVWLKNIRNNIVPCGQPVIDDAINKYGLQKKGFVAYAIAPWHSAEFDAGFNINTLPLSYKIMTVPGVSSAGQNLLVYDGPDMRDSVNTNFVELGYSYRWGSCITGCTYVHYWIFRVYNDCSVQYMGTKGDPLPPWASINKQSASLSNFRVFPVPSTDKVTIDALNVRIVSLVLYNTLGQEVLHLAVSDSKLDMDISHLEKGVYYMKVQTSSGQGVSKFIKE